MSQDFQQTIRDDIEELVDALNVVEEDARQTLSVIGWDLDAVAGDLPGLLDAIKDVARKIGAFREKTAPKNLLEFAELLVATIEVFEALARLNALAAAPRAGVPLGELGLDLLHFAVTTTIRLQHPVLYRLLVLLSVIDPEHEVEIVAEIDPSDPTGPQKMLRIPYKAAIFRAGQIPDLLTSPVETLKEEYPGWELVTEDDAIALSNKLLGRIADLLTAMGIDATYGTKDYGQDFGEAGAKVAARTLTVLLSRDDEELSGLSAMFSSQAEGDSGLVITPFAKAKFTPTIGRWQLEFVVDARVNGFAVGGNGLVIAPRTGVAPTRVELSLRALRLGETPKSANDDGGPVAFAIGGTEGTRLEIGDFELVVRGAFEEDRRDYGFLVSAGRSALILDAGDGDGFLQKVLGLTPRRIEFGFGLGWSNTRGLLFQGAGGLELTLPTDVSILGVVDITAVTIAIRARGGTEPGQEPEVNLELSANARAELGPITAAVERIGVESRLTFPGQGGSLGPIQADLVFKSPTGVGLKIDAGAVTGGGSLSFDRRQGRYGGAVELKVYSVNVKAFGLIETKLPDGTPGFSFVIVISAEFTPIQLGLGFTLNGVGGVIGINRRLEEQALADAVRGGSLGHLLFPRDVTENAPLIIHELRAILPAAEGHYVFGPMAKIGWGTPTLIEADLGLILELPGPRLALLGEIRANLPKKNAALVKLNVSIAGVLDFPKKFLAFDASLHDSMVGSFPLSGDMALRLSWGDTPNFALAVGGFHPAFQVPPGFPALKRVTIDLGASGNPSLTVQGYLAVTSNTAQIGALAELNARGAGIKLYCRLQLDALFVFSPFSFEVAIAARVRVTFKGYGLGAHLSGTLSGPSPWRVRGRLCVSILWWDACLGFDASFGGARRVELNPIDPWSAQGEVVGLKIALQDLRNWRPELPPGGFIVVSLAEPADEATPIDPIGAATVTQRVCPLNVKLQRFGAVKALGNAEFKLASVKVNKEELRDKVTFLKEAFAPAQYFQLSDGQKLSAPAFQKLDGGARIPAGANLRAGSVVVEPLNYVTKVKDETGELSDVPDRPVPAEHLEGMRRRSASALFGARRVGAEAYVDPLAPRRFAIDDEQFVIARLDDLKVAEGDLGTPRSKIEATLELERFLADNPTQRNVYQILPTFEARAA